ncbi:MAG TPA: hypothetical protein VN799_07965 [Acidimicrobiales bacterium]|nr:hypothetical protein [Acidimicrobiales bacterium]
MPVPLDEYPVHQVPLSMRHVATSDRNAYDRCYLNAHDRTGEIFLVTGLGVYPNLGVIDAYATVRRGDRQLSVRMSDALSDDRTLQQVGPYRIEVIEPLERLRLVLDHDTVGFDLTWAGSFPVIDEPAHVMRQGGRVILDAQRYAQVGTWSGTLRVEGEEIAVTDDRWLGTRDRSWGIRPVGESEPAGRAAAEPAADFGFWWVYAPLRFDDYALIIIAQELGDGTRILNEASRVWPASTGRPPEQLGWPEFEIRYRPGTRHPEGATIHLTERGGRRLTVEIDTLGFVALNCGAGYGGDPDWGHGQWRGSGWVEPLVLDMNDPAVAGRVPFSVVDHVGRAVCDGDVGWGMFEHGTFGRHTPSGFADFTSVAP